MRHHIHVGAVKSVSSQGSVMNKAVLIGVIFPHAASFANSISCSVMHLMDLAPGLQTRPEIPYHAVETPFFSQCFGISLGEELFFVGRHLHLEVIKMNPIEVNKSFPNLEIRTSSVFGSHSTNRLLWTHYAV